MPGVIVMELVSAPEGGNGTYDPSYERLVTVFNCAPYGNDVPYPASVPQGARLQVCAVLHVLP